MKNGEQGKSGEAEQRKQRLFFALWPDRQAREALHAIALSYQPECGGRVMRAETLHLTLLFLGDIPAQRELQLQAAAAAVRGKAFDFALEKFCGWRHNAIGYAAPAELPRAMAALVEQLRSEVAQAGFAFDARAFSPHVTLLRKMERPQTVDIPPIPWLVRDFVLVESVLEDGRMQYRVRGRWPLIES